MAHWTRRLLPVPSFPGSNPDGDFFFVVVVVVVVVVVFFAFFKFAFF